MVRSITDATLVINNQVVDYVPNSLEYTEGKGEQTVSTLTGGGGAIRTVSSDNAESKMSNVKFSLKNIAEHIELARSWKSNQDENVIELSYADGFTRTFQLATLTNDYAVGLGSDSTIDLEFMSLPAV